MRRTMPAIPVHAPSLAKPIAEAALAALIMLAMANSGKPAEKSIEATVKQVQALATRGPYQPNWTSLQRYKVPQWYMDAKFGIFIHWGVYSVPAFSNEWYPRDMYLVGSPVYKHHLETYGPQSKFGYKEFIPMFQAQKFDAQRWAQLFQEAGAKYVVPVA